MANPRKVAVFGAGIIGAACAWHLAQQGARVALLDACPAAGGVATPLSFSWINATFGNPRPYFDLRMCAISGWRRWATLFPDAGIRFSGGLFYELEGTALDEFVEEHSGWGYSLKVVRRKQIAELEPLLADVPEKAALAAEEGFVEASGFAARLATSPSITLRAPAEVTALLVANGAVTGVMTASGPLAADVVLLAAGERTPEILATAGVDFSVDSPAGLLVTTTPLRGRLRQLLIGPRVHVRQLPDGRLLAGSDFLGSHDTQKPERTAAGIVAELRAMFGEPSLSMQKYTIGKRPTPRDGYPAIGPVPGIDGLFVAVTHSGVTLAPAIGEMLAGEIMGGAPDPLLAPFRFARFRDGGAPPTP